jgi:hypothetical protein
VANRAKIDSQTTIVQIDRFTVMRDIAWTLHLNRINPLPRAPVRLQIAHAKIAKIDFNVITQTFEAAHMTL